MKLLSVYIEHTNPYLNHPFTYYAQEEVNCYTRVEVEFNRQVVIGFVSDVRITDQTLQDLEAELGYAIKPIRRLIDDEALLNAELMALAHEMAYQTISPLISCLNTILPPNLKPKTTKQLIAHEKWIKRIAFSDELNFKGQSALLALDKPMLYKTFNQEYKNVIKTLKAKGLVEIYDVRKSLKTEVYPLQQALALTVEQQRAFNQILEGDKSVYLVHGVTGSGKTELYLQLSFEMIKQGKQVLILVPEIALTPQMVKRVTLRFQDKVAIYHSGLSAAEKLHQYKLVKDNQVSVVVGTRSSVFMPFLDLGLIIMDEEHDASYAQDSTPCYHALSMALLRQKHHRCKLVLGSATPSLESYARAIKGNYQLVELKQRVNLSPPEIKVIDLNQIVRSNDDYMISNELKKAISLRLDKGEQVIILLNRRGYSSILKCNHCQEVMTCVDCDIALSYHKDGQVLKCHMCDYTTSRFDCPKCHHHLSTSFGYGIQKVEEVLKKLFVTARIERMDRDTTRIKKGHELILNRFENHEIDILIGTQMIAKGLDYPLVSLVAILNGDSGLNRLDYRSQETVFDLMMQASGRGGRHKLKGEVLLQVYNPKHYAVLSVIKQDYLAFFKEEMRYRHQGQYPPYTYLISLLISHVNQDHCLKATMFISNQLSNNGYKTLGPTSLPRIKALHRYRFILKGKDLNLLIEEANRIVDLYYQMKHYAKLKVEVNPLYLE